jgi:hypothetical protein
MNPTKIVEVQVPLTGYQDQPIDNTDWFNASKKEPGQPGVFEVDPLSLDDKGDELRRFAFFNGKDFAAVMQTPGDAYAARFDKRVSPVTRFRGLVEAV